MTSLMPPRKRRVAARARDMATSPFSAILDDLVRRLPGAIGAVLVDHDGETVDYMHTGDIEPYDLRVAGAHWRIVLDMCSRTVRTLLVRGTKRTYVVRALPERYAVIVLLAKRAGFAPFERPFAACELALAVEAGWKTRAGWCGIIVRCDAKRRPAWIEYGGLSESVEVLGTLSAGSIAAGLSRRERGYRIRLASGPEITVVRDAAGHWYADEQRF